MTDVPLQSISISDFRRLNGHRDLPLDAPIVLLHGPNGTGKTSVLSALELALTGEIRSMHRHDLRYTAHLPFHGQDFAKLRVAVSKQLAAHLKPVTMTVGGSRVDGEPALEREAAQFYAERCYLDQVSLGRLLELYQYREGNEESALARFVNELLGLEQLDALRSGLSDSTDFRRLKRLSEPLAEADDTAKQSNTDLSRATKELESERAALARSQDELETALRALGLEVPKLDDQNINLQVGELLRTNRPADDHPAAQDLTRWLTALGGRIQGLSDRPSVKRLDEARAALATITRRYADWREKHELAIDAWHRDAAELGVHATREETLALDNELKRINRTVRRQEELADRRTRIEDELADGRLTLGDLQARFTAAQEETGSLVEGLGALRAYSYDNICPVCDRNFSEVASAHLTVHIDQKIAEVTEQGVFLRELRDHRDVVANEVQHNERVLEDLRGELLSDSERQAAISRQSSLIELYGRLEKLQPAIDRGRELHAQTQTAEAALEDLEAIAHEVTAVRSELEGVAEALGSPKPSHAQPLQSAWRRLADTAADQLASAESSQQAHDTATRYLEQTQQLIRRVASLKESVTTAAERKSFWENRVHEARRRQTVAREIHDASSEARTEIVQRVFTESLNNVWRSVFMRLAPREPFIPTFGIPTSSKTALELTLETVHRSGEPGGSPQMMLSAGNLNTAALSLFIALHLAVEPLVPCLVFDDPVQSMDEVHIAQFAGLIRVLSKYHKRQIIIAVHERELFEYLALELSPAYENDELITIELGERSEDEDGGVTRLTWSPDPAIAV